MSINRVTLTGRLTRDCEVRRTNSGFTIVSLGLAVNERRKDRQTGEWKDEANYFDCVCMGERYEKLSQYLTKGTQLAIDGKLRWSQWERDGQKRSKVEVIVDDVELLGSREDRQQGGSKPQAVKAEVIEPPSSVYDDDIPFN